MNILTIPLRNTKRKPMRTLLLLAVFSLGIVSITALNFVSKVVGDSLEKKLNTYGANILVSPTTETLTVSYGGFNMGDLMFEVQYLDAADTVAKIKTIEEADRLSAIAPKLVTMAEVGGMPVGVVGVDMVQERRIKSYLAVDGTFPSKENQVVVGSAVSEKLGLTMSSPIKIMGQYFFVSGVLYETGTEDDNVILADLGALQKLTGREGKANFIEVAALCADCPIDEITAQIIGKLDNVDVKAMRNIVEQRMYSVNFVKQLVLTVSLVILVSACAVIGLSMLASVNERKKEIGILRSLGYSKRSVFGIFSSEALLIGFLAGVIGYIGGYAVSFKVLEVLDIAEDAVIVFQPELFAAVCGVVMLVSLLSAAAPAWKASRIEPSQALVTL